MLQKVINRMEKQGIKLEITKEARDCIVENGKDDKYGARPLRRTIQNMVEDKIAERILEGNVSNKILLSAKNGKIIFE